MAVLIQGTCGNCGHGQMQSLYGGPIPILKEAAKDAYKNFGIINFSDGVKNRNGQNLADKIKELGLGEVVETREVQNPLYQKGHMIKAWMWIVDRPALVKWAKGLETVAVKGATPAQPLVNNVPPPPPVQFVPEPPKAVDEPEDDDIFIDCCDDDCDGCEDCA